MARAEMHKTVPLEIKSVSEAGAEGSVGGSPVVEGLGACFLSLDKTGDIIAPGAFKDSIPEWIAGGFIGGLNHAWDNPIGHPVEARETADGLWFKAVLDDSTAARDALARMKVNPESGRATIRKLSIGYKALDAERLDVAGVKSYWQTKGYRPGESEVKAAESGKGARLLKRVSLFEVSPVSIPANDRALILSAKAFGMGYGMGGPSADPDDLEDSVRDAVLSTIHNYLCMALRAIVSNDMLSGDDRLALIGPAFDQCRDATLQYLKPLMGGEDAEDVMEDVGETLDTLSKSLLARLPEGAAQYTVKALALEPGASLDRYFPAVDTALRDFSARNRFRLDVRLKEGRVLSAANVERIRAMRDSLRDHADNLHEMIESATPQTKPKGNSPFGGLPKNVLSVVNLGGPNPGDFSGPVKSDADATEGETPVAVDVEVKVGVVPYARGPILDDAAWDGAAADDRVRKWASKDGSGDKDTMDWGKYAKAFAYIDPDSDGPHFADFHLLHHDVEGGELKVARRGVFAAAVIIQGGRGGGAKFVAALPEGAEAGIKGHLGKHYQDMKMTAPWDESKSAPPDLAVFFAQFHATHPLLTGGSVAHS